MPPEAPSPGAEERARPTPVTPHRSPANPVSTPPPPIPDHDLIRLIAQGSYGEVWLGRSALGTWRAVKIVHRHTFWHDHPFDREFTGIQKFEPISRSHEGLVDILQVGRGEGFFYYVMELADSISDEWRVTSHESSASGVRGLQAGSDELVTRHLSLVTAYAPRTLSSELHARGRLPVAECLSIALSLVSALEHLHQHGLVHRDVKPSNVIFVGGVPKLADIGMVAEVSEARSYVGTEGFIPPEGPGTPQADLYSLGKLLYEISTGKDRHEFPALPPNLDELPDKQQLIELNAILLKTCNPDPRRRHGSAASMRAELELLQRGGSIKRRRAAQHRSALARKAATALAVLVLLGAFGYLLFARFTRPIPIPVAAGTDRVSIFVLPFRHSAPIAERPIEYETEQTVCVCGRMTDAFIDALSLIPGVKTGPRKSDWIRYDEDQVRRELVRTNDTRYLLTGRVDHTNNVLRFTLGFYEREKDEPLWTKTFTGTTNDLIALERRAMEWIANRLDLPRGENCQRQIDQTLSNNLAAYGLFLQGRQSFRTSATKSAYDRALDDFSRALKLDGNYVAAHVGIISIRRELFSDASPRRVWPEMGDRARRVLEIDDTCFVAQYRLANMLLQYDYDWEHAIEAHDRLIATWRDRNLSWAVYYRILGRTNEARVYHDRLQQEPEVDRYELQHLALGEVVWRHYDEAVRIADRMIELAPDSPGITYTLGRCLLAAGDYRKAIEALTKSREGWDDPETWGLLGRAYALAGDRTKALELLRQLEPLVRSEKADPYYLAWIHAALDQKDKALDYLEKAYDYRSELLVAADFGGLRTDSAWDGLRDDPRFEALCGRVGMGKDQWPK